MNEIGGRIAELRKQSLMTQSELGEKLNVSAQAVSKWENGLSEPDISTLAKLSEIFEISIDEMIGRTGKPHEEEVQSTVEQPPVVAPPTSQSILCMCADCNKPLYKKEEYEETKVNTTVRDEEGIERTISVSKPLCLACVGKRKKATAQGKAREKNREYEERSSSIRRSIGWGIFAAIVCAIAAVVAIVMNPSTVHIACAAPLVYAGFAFAASLCLGDAAFDVLDFFMHSFRLPGLIFTLDLDGIIWFITVKLTLSILAGILSALLFLVGVAVTAIFSAFYYPFGIVYSVRKRKELKSELDALAAK